MKQEFYETGGVIDNGHLKLSGKPLFEETMRRFPDGHVTVRVEVTRPKRSNAQNRYWHGVVIPAFAEHCGYEFEEMKDALALKLIPKEVVDLDTGKVRIVPGHTSELNNKAFNDLIERAQRLGAELNIYIPDPGEDLTPASAPAKIEKPAPVTHYSPLADSPGRYATAWCGRRIDLKKEHSVEPTCPRCAQRQQEYESGEV